MPHVLVGTALPIVNMQSVQTNNMPRDAASVLILASFQDLVFHRQKVQHRVAATFFQSVLTASVDGGLNSVQILELQPIYGHLKDIGELDCFSHSIRPFTCYAATPLICLQ